MGSRDDAQLMRVSPAEAGEHGMARADALGGEVGRSAELAVAQLEAQARAQVQARFFMAAKMRRTWDDVEQRLLRECKRPRFAAAAWYVKPIGRDEAKWPRGLSIRFAEAALRVAGNIDVQVQTVFDDEWKRVVRVAVLDLETNFGYTKEVSIDKTVERKSPGSREIISARQNSSGESTYLVFASEDEVTVKQNAMISKEIRTQGLRLIPGDILDECKTLIQYTIQQKATEDPEAARKEVFDNFATLGVMPADIAKYLEHDTANLLPAEVVTLRGIFVAIKNGDATWKDVMQAKFGAEEGEESEAAKKIKEKLAKTTSPKAKPEAKPEAKAAEKPKEEPKLTSQPRQQPPAPKEEVAAEKPAHEEPMLSLRRYEKGEMPDAMELRLGTKAEYDGHLWQVIEDGDNQNWEDLGPLAKHSAGQAAQRSAPATTGFNFRRGGK